LDSARQALGSSILIEVGEIERSKITIRHLIAQDIISSRKDRGCHG
jgi:hypothetical protein